jgi:hypothetical protein
MEALSHYLSRAPSPPSLSSTFFLSRSFILPPQVHFREVCAILFENCDAGRFFDSDTFYRTGSLELACTQCPPGRFNARSNKLPECELCQAGTYYPDYGATKCIR